MSQTMSLAEGVKLKAKFLAIFTLENPEQLNKVLGELERDYSQYMDAIKPLVELPVEAVLIRLRSDFPAIAPMLAGTAAEIVVLKIQRYLKEGNMVGRQDYEEKKENRIERLNEAAKKASKQSDDYAQRSHDLIKDIPFGQPNINGSLTGTLNKSRSAMDSSIKSGEKSTYYAEKAEAAQNNRAISSDDPQAIEKLKAKLEKLETKRTAIKELNKKARKNGTEQAPWYALPYLSKDIKAVKERIEKLEKLDSIQVSADIGFDGGTIVENTNINRVQIIFDSKPDQEIIDKLKSNGFHWSPSEKAWQRMRGIRVLDIAKAIVI